MTAGSDPIPVATVTADGLMSTTDKNIYDAHIVDMNMHLDSDQNGSLDANPLLTSANPVMDFDTFSGHTGNDSRHLLPGQNDALDTTPALSSANKVVTETSFSGHTNDYTVHITADQNGALDAAEATASINAGNRVAAMSDIIDKAADVITGSIPVPSGVIPPLVLVTNALFATGTWIATVTQITLPAGPPIVLPLYLSASITWSGDTYVETLYPQISGVPPLMDGILFHKTDAAATYLGPPNSLMISLVGAGALVPGALLQYSAIKIG